MRGTRAIIHLEALERNIQAVRSRAGPGREICFPVKANAYGHGAAETARFALEAGAGRLAVATADEGELLRREGITAPILLLSVPLPEEIPDIVENGLSPLVPDREFAAALAAGAARTGKRVAVHLKIDTGMGRIGAGEEEAADLARFVAAQRFLEIAGTATHLAAADSLRPEDMAFTAAQVARFRQALTAIRAAGLDPGTVHAANSGAVLLHPEAHFDMVRPGIMLYGYSPLSGSSGPGAARDAGGNAVSLEPVMELRSRLVFVKKIKKGDSVSYGRTWTAPEDTWLGTIPAGYADGLPRSLSNRFSVVIRGQAYPLAGRICMDQCMVNLGPDCGAARWDDVTIFGGPGAGADEAARLTGTIPYEILCNVSRRVPRVYGP